MQLKTLLRFSFFLIVVLLIIYIPVFGTFAFSDSYEFFWSSKTVKGFINVFIQGGRPLFGIANSHIFPWTDSISDLRYIRLIAVLGNTVLAISFFYVLLKKGFDKMLSLCLVLFLIVSPFFTLSIGWTALYQAGWAMLAGLLSAVLILEENIEYNLIKQIMKKLLGVLFAMISLMLYQPSFTIFIFIAFLYFEKDKNYKKFIRAVVLYLAVFLLYYILFKLILHFTELPPLDRSGIATDYFGKLKWFIKTAFHKSLALNLVIFKSSIVNLLRIPLLLFFCSAAVFSFVKRKDLSSWMVYSAIVVATYFLAYLPNLVSVDSYASSRSLGVLVLLNAYFLFKGIGFLIKKKKYVYVLYTVLALLFLIIGFINVRKGFVNTLSNEYMTVKAELLEILKSDPDVKNIYIIPPTGDFLTRHDLVGKTSYDEFGILSTSKAWVPKPMVYSLISEITNYPKHRISNINILICDDKNSGCGSPVIDIEQSCLSYVREK